MDRATTPMGAAETRATSLDSATMQVLDDLFDPFMVFAPITDPDGHVVDFRYAYLNDAAGEYARVRRDDLVGRSVLDLYPGERGTEMSAMYVSVYESGETVVVDDVRLPDEAVHAERYADVRLRRVGDLLYYSVRDATTRHNALRDLEQSESRYRLLAENSSDVVFLRDHADVVAWVSPSVREVLGWDPEALVGTMAGQLVHPDDRPGVSARQRRLDGKQRVSGDLLRVLRADGSYRVMSVTARALDASLTGLSGVVIGLRDVDDLVHERETARFEAARRRSILATLIDPHVLLEAVRDGGGRIVDFLYREVNEAACAYHQATREQLLGSRLTEVVPAHRNSASLAIYAEVVESGEPFIVDDYEFPIGIEGFAARFLDMRAVRLGDSVSVTWRDVTERHEAASALASSEERYRLLAENSFDVVLHTRASGIVWVSPALTRTLGWSPAEWIGRSLSDFWFPGDAAAVEAALARMRAGAQVVMRMRMADTAGTFHWIEVHAQQYTGPDDTADGFIWSFRQVDEEVSIEQELEYRARFDDLTGVLKRDEALFRLSEIGQQVRSPGALTGVLFIDVDEFKTVNDRWGHSAGDSVLRAVTDRIRASIRAGDEVARLGGDEFLVVLDGIDELAEVERVAEKIRLAVRAPVRLRDAEAVLTVSIGATVSEGGESASAMVTRADDAMYRAKNSGRDRVVAEPGPARRDGGRDVLA